MFQGKITHIHFVGIGGTGMNGIAEVLLNMGFTITGSDLSHSSTVERLEDMGATVHIGHEPKNIIGAHVVVKSTAIPNHNIEIVTAKEQNIPVIPRAEMLAELMRMKYGIAVAGTHGKTTTTSMLALCLYEGGLDPTTVIGGRLDALGSSAKMGHGEYLVAEADESDGSFMLLSPTIAVITNIDPEHLEYWKTEENLIDGFTRFASKVPFFGCAVLCLDHHRVQSIVPKIHRRIVTYGLSSQAMIRATHINQVGLSTEFTVIHNNNVLGKVHTNMPGKHNISNALAAIAVSLELNIPFSKIQKALNNFDGVNRRFTIRAKGALEAGTEEVTVIDDYGHHPVEIEATLQAARDSWPVTSITAIFQPHRYSRVRDHFDDFCQSFNNANRVIIVPIYSAGERPIEGLDQHSLAEKMKAFGHRNVLAVNSLEEATEIVTQTWKAGEIVITLGAGNVNQVCSQLKETLRARMD